MSASEFYSHGNFPANGAQGSSSAMRSELEAIENGLSAKMPDLSGNGSKIVAINSGASALEAITTTGTGSGVRATSPTLTSPTLVTPALGTPASGTLTNCTLPVGGVSGLGTGVATFLATPSSVNLKAAVTDETGSGALVFATSPALVTPDLGVPSAITLTNATGLPVGGITGFGSGVATFLATPSSANLASAVTGETGSGALVFGTAPTIASAVLTTPDLGTPSAGTLTNCTIPVGGVSGLGSGVATFLATPSSANLASAVTGETGSGALVFGTAPTIDNPTITNWVGSTGITTLGTVTTGTWSATTVAVNKGGTGQTSYTDGQLLIGNSTGNTLTKATLTAGSGITVTNGGGTVTIAANPNALASAITSAAAIANTETVVSSYVCAANELAAGTTFHFRAAASQAGTNAANPTIRIRVGTTTLTGNIAAALTGVSGSGGTPSWFEGFVTVRTAGAGGTVIASICHHNQSQSRVEAQTATVAVDTTAASQRIEFTFISGNAANTFTFQNATVVKVVA
jgi:hypothetical protein